MNTKQLKFSRLQTTLEQHHRAYLTLELFPAFPTVIPCSTKVHKPFLGGPWSSWFYVYLVM